MLKNCFSAVDFPHYFSNAQDSVVNAQGCCAHHTTKLGCTYQHVCSSDCLYVGSIPLGLKERITQHISKQIRNKETPTKVLSRRNCKAKIPLKHLECDSAIGLKLHQNPVCAAHYHDLQFSILAKART